ncbi:hypothetical protein D3C71_1840970 [compost metagenome]
MLGRLGILLFDHGIAAEHLIARRDGERFADLYLILLFVLLAFTFRRLGLVLLLIAVNHLPAQA